MVALGLARARVKAGFGTRKDVDAMVAAGRVEVDGEQVRDGIVVASQFAAVDPHRAATHNKGIMNGIDAVALATGNDWRAVEAGAHAYAARGTHYTSLSKWTKGEDGSLIGTIELPLRVGIVATK